jgi:hypothetical protein
MQRKLRITRNPKTIDEYLAALSNDQRAALEKLRKAIRAAVPRAEECLSYQLPAFRLDGRGTARRVPGRRRLRAAGDLRGAGDTRRGLRHSASRPTRIWS